VHYQYLPTVLSSVLVINYVRSTVILYLTVTLMYVNKVFRASIGLLKNLLRKKDPAASAWVRVLYAAFPRDRQFFLVIFVFDIG
jgi:hypothetical protein